MGYNENGFMIEKYKRRHNNDKKYFQIWFEWLNDPLRGKVNKSNQTEYFETREQARKVAKQEIRRRESK